MQILSSFTPSLKARIIGLSCIFALVTSIAVIWSSMKAEGNAREARATAMLSTEAEIIAARLEADFENMAGDLRLIALTPPIDGLIRSGANGGIDGADGSTQEQWKTRLETIFTSMMQVRPSYAQVRFIGLADNGRELVRVNRKGGQLVPVAKDDLQSKSSEPYFKSSLNQSYGEVRFHRVSPNRENGQIESESVPMLRLTLPIFDQGGARFGMIVINIDIEKRLQTSMQKIDPVQKAYLVTGLGDIYWYNPVLKKGGLILADGSESEEDAALASEVNQSPLPAAFRLDGENYVKRPIGRVDNTDNLRAQIVLQETMTVGLSTNLLTPNDGTGFILAILLGAFVIVVVCATQLTDPLRKMTERIALYAQVDQQLELDLPTDDPSEVGELARSFTKLVEKLEDSRSQFASIVNSAGEGIMVLDADSRIIHFNPVCEEIFGYSHREIQDQEVEMLLLPNDESGGDAGGRFVPPAIIPEMVGRSGELSVRHRSGGVRTIELALSEMMRDGNRFYCGIVRDKSEEIAQRKAFERQQRTLSLALEGGELGLWDWDIPSGRVAFNDIWAAMVGYDVNELAQDFSTWERLVEPSDLASTSEALQQHLDGVTDHYDVQFRMRHKAGHWVWIRSKGCVTERGANGEPIRVVGVHIDISGQKETELDTIERNRQLEQAELIANMGHWSLDSATQEQTWSEGIFRIYGLDPADGMPTLEAAIAAYHPDDRDLVQKKVEAALMQGEPFEFNLRVVRPDGEIRHVISKADIIHSPDQDGATTVFGVFLDVTDRVRANEQLRLSEQRNSLLLQNMVDGVLTVDGDGKIVSCNPACADIFGYTKDAMKGLSIEALMPETYRDAHTKGMQRYLTTGKAKVLGKTLELRGVRLNGEEFDLELSISAFQASQGTLFTGILRDISERKQMEIMKDEFVSTVNHELRTPLTSIYGSLDLLKRLSKGKLDEKGERLITLAHDGCARLTSLVNDILDIEKIAAGKMDYHLENCHIRDLVDDIVQRHEGLATQFDVKFVVDHGLEEEVIKADASRFNQALVNLLSNAAKFSPPGSEVTISTCLSPRTGCARISVQDRGPGIPDGFRDKLYERFSQADSSATRNVAGTGLGLSITKAIIEAFGGEISFETEIDTGTIFHFDLPIENQPAQAAA